MRISILSVSLKILTVLFLLGTWAVFAPPAAAQRQTLTGWFSMTVADYPPESGRTAETTYGLTDDQGEYHELLIDLELMRPLDGPVALNRKRVTVEGEYAETLSDAPAKFRVRSIRLAAPRSGPSALPASPDAPSKLHTTVQATVTGSQAWVTILCRFADATDVTPYPVSHFERMTGSSYPALGHYWKEVSYGNLPYLRGSVVVGWYDLPQPRSYYVSDTDGDGEEDHNTQRTVEDCVAAADADVFFPNFWGINLVFNQNLHGPAQGSGRFLTLDGRSRFWGVTWLPEWAHEKQDTWAHEMGHAFGLQHSSGPYGQDDPLFSSATTYDSEWDVMSGGESLAPYPGYGYLGVHTIAYHKDFLGWIPANRKYVATRNSTRTITLERLAQPGSEGYLMAQIPIGDSPTDFYTVETRLFAGYDDEIPDEAVVIHKVDTTLDDRLAQVVDIDNNGDTNDEGAMWTVGEIFTDAENNLQISIDAAYASGYRVTINTNPDTFSTCIDFLASSSHLFGPGRDGAGVQVEAASDCNWSATSHAEWIHITSGGTGSGSDSVRYTVANNPSPAVRTGRLTIDGWMFTVVQAGINDHLFADNMESGTNGWSVYAPWALTTASARSGTHAWTDSPGGNYQNNQRATLWSPWTSIIDLTSVDSATLTFWHRYDFGKGDRGYVWVAREKEEGSWVTETVLRAFTGTNPTWQQTSFDMTPFVGARIRIVFDFISDASETADGWYIDDVAVFSSDFETPAPDPDYCRDYGPCSAGQGDCDPGQCTAGLICTNDVGAQYGLPAHYDVCEARGSGQPDPDYCVTHDCGVGQGDCDPGQCTAGLICTNDVGAQYGLPPHYDVCEARGSGSPDPDYCRDYGPCSAGQGDCDPGQCAAGLVCVNDVGEQYGLPPHYDVCEARGSGSPDPDYCRDYGPCSAGQGDCDPGQCAAGLVCVNDVGEQYGLPPHYDVCEGAPDRILFEDDMENGENGWGTNSPWALTTTTSHSGTHAWTDSPDGNYQNDVNIALRSPQPPLYLTEIDSATLTFWHRYAFASGDEGNVWVQLENEDFIHLKSFTGSQAEWQQAEIDLTPFVGQSIRFYFQLLSDASETADGWTIDDVAVFSSDFDTSAPDPDLCRDYGPCSTGQGDCDPGQCAAGLVCVNDVGGQYGLPAHYDVCEVPSG